MESVPALGPKPPDRHWRQYRMEPFSPQLIQAARKNLRPHVLRTPLVPSPALSRLCGCRVHLKMECWQVCGCFKVRGVTNFLTVHRREAQTRGIVTASSGNHALALAHTAAAMGLEKPAIFVPEGADPAKVDKIRLAGAEPVLKGENFFAAFDNAQAHANRTGACFVHSHADPLVIAGQGTIGLEILEDLPEVDAVVVPIGGGGLIAGICAAVKANAPAVRIIGAEPEAAPGAYLSLKSGKPCERIYVKPSIADGLSGGLSPLPYAIAAALIEQVVLVSEEAVAGAMRAFFAVEQLVVEGAASVGLAVLLSGSANLDGRNVVVVVTGRNINSRRFLDVIGREGSIPA
jgi:threonine dehydratase